MLAVQRLLQHVINGGTLITYSMYLRTESTHVYSTRLDKHLAAKGHYVLKCKMCTELCSAYQSKEDKTGYVGSALSSPPHLPVRFMSPGRINTKWRKKHHDHIKQNKNMAVGRNI